MQHSIDRRRFERFLVEPSYTSVGLRTLDREVFDWSGHAFDLSEGGIRFEMDRGFDPGTPVAMRIDLPRCVPGMEFTADRGPGRAVFVTGNIVWADDQEPGPVQMALAITRFCRAGDRDRLVKLFMRGGRSLRAA
jgi:hypothetical protein